MASQHQSWITLDSCIYDYISAAELGNNKYFKLFNLAFRGMEDLGLDFFYQIKSLKLPILANKTVQLPPDFLKYTKIGVLNGIGELVPLKYNEKLTSFKDLSNNRVSEVGSPNLLNYYSYSSSVFFNFWNGNGYSNLYGISGAAGYVGGFKIDIANGVIILDPSFNYPDLVIEYTASPTEGQEYFIPMEFREALISWLSWQDIIHLPTSRRGSIGDKQTRRHEYFESRRRAIAKFRPFYLDQAYITHLEGQRLTVKA